jgi:hypothetical protein
LLFFYKTFGGLKLIIKFAQIIEIMGKSQLSYDDEQVAYLHKVYSKLNRGRKGLKQDIVDMSI